MLATLVLPLLVPIGQPIYIDASATPPGTGTPENPYTSIQYAIDRPTTGPWALLYVRPGLYVENIHMPEFPISVLSTGGPKQTRIEAAGPGPVVTVDSTSGNLHGFTITGTAGTDAGIYFHRFFPTSDVYLSVANCVVVDIAGPAIISEAYVGITRCTLVGNERAVELVDIPGVAPSGVAVSEVLAWGNAFPSIVNNDPFNFFEYSLHDGGLDDGTCIGCLTVDPELWDLVGRDLQLRPGSPCIDAGDPFSGHEPDGSVRDIGALMYDPTHMPWSWSCAGTAELCPCGNAGTDGAGCDLAQGTGGTAIDMQAFAPDGAGGGTTQFVGTGYPAASSPAVVLIRSSALVSTPVVLGDGLRCISAGGLVRVGTTLASGGAALLPVSHGAGSGSFHYQLWARNQPAAFCDPAAAFNLSNALSVTWP